jgi:hypothetical protein
MQGFDENKITSGIKGDLRQEFRELEILDKITRLHFAGKLPGAVTGVYRRELLRSYKLCTGGKTLTDAPHVHPVLRYNDTLDNNNEITEYSEWMLSSKDQTKRKATADLDSSPTKKCAVHSREAEVGVLGHNAPRHYEVELVGCHPRNRALSPLGLIWDHVNHSYAYDSLFTCLTQARVERSRWLDVVGDTSPLMGVWDIGMSEWPTVPEKARNNVHEILHFMNPREFPRGPVPIRLDPLFRAIANDKTYAAAVVFCDFCHYREPGAAATFGQVQEIGVPERLSSVHPEGVRINAWYTDHLDKYVKACPQCRLNGVACRM